MEPTRVDLVTQYEIEQNFVCLLSLVLWIPNLCHRFYVSQGDSC